MKGNTGAAMSSQQPSCCDCSVPPADSRLLIAPGLVKERPLDQWKETLAVLCSHSNSDEFQGLCDALARRVSRGGLTHAATLCWICASKVDQALHVWAKELLGKQASVGELQVSFA